MGGLGGLFFQSVNTRQPASLLPSPKLRLKPWPETLVGKAHAAINVRISVIGQIPNHDNQELHLKAEVTLNQLVDREVKFQWSLPSEASVVSGNLEDAWANLLPGQTATTEITVLNVSKESVEKTIHLHVSGLANGIQYAGTGSFEANSLEENASGAQTGISAAGIRDLALKKQSSADKMKSVQQ